MESLSTPLMLLAVGMGTVFFILLFIIFFSKGLILVVNRFFPEEVVRKSDRNDDDSGAVSSHVKEIIAKAVGQVAPGSKITTIKKL